MPSRERAPIPEFGNRRDGVDYIDRPGVYALIENHNKQIAIIETRNGYFLPGGGIDFGESEMEALTREIREEIGYQACMLTEMGEAVEYIEAHSDKKFYHIRSRFYRVQLGAKIGEGAQREERLVWLWPEEAIKLLTRQGQAWAVQRITEG